MNTYQIENMAVPYREEKVHMDRIAFYAENPRIYSQFADTASRTQESIQQKLGRMEHVRALRALIERDKSVNEPLLCAEVAGDSDLYDYYDFIVLEGNSRLAALRLEKSDRLPPVDLLPCKIFDFANFTNAKRDSFIFSLLSRIHITGKKGWIPYEEAGYVHRRFTAQSVPISQIAKEIGKSKQSVDDHLEAFKLMQEANGDPKNWSYYYEYVKTMRSHRKEHANLDKIVLPKIPKGFNTAQDMRKGLKAIFGNNGNKRVVKKFINEEVNFHEAWEITKEAGRTNPYLRKLFEFQKMLHAHEIEIRELLKSDEDKKKTEFYLKKISTRINHLLSPSTVKAQPARSTVTEAR